ncbi:hypothetical protein CDD81_1647 [Ophiocordyceps australis]|uniref:Uncharacterized protein n=1 Tax=Ophiocordyceps australis TaxID=1399860 RepID=A0A2C5XT36_9HYPO|nr:hypothetical protein CDD81_1647 [Ophiocordyceps australis]
MWKHSDMLCHGGGLAAKGKPEVRQDSKSDGEEGQKVPIQMDGWRGICEVSGVTVVGPAGCDLPWIFDLHTRASMIAYCISLDAGLAKRRVKRRIKGTVNKSMEKRQRAGRASANKQRIDAKGTKEYCNKRDRIDRGKATGVGACPVSADRARYADMHPDLLSSASHGRRGRAWSSRHNSDHASVGTSTWTMIDGWLQQQGKPPPAPPLAPGIPSAGARTRRRAPSSACGGYQDREGHCGQQRTCRWCREP